MNVEIIKTIQKNGADYSASVLNSSQLVRLAKGIISSLRTEVREDSISLTNNRVVMNASPSDIYSNIGVRPTDGVQQFSSSGEVTNYQKNNIFIGYTSVMGDVANLDAVTINETIEDYVNACQTDLKSYRVFRFYSRPDDVVAKGTLFVLVIGLVANNLTDAYTPFATLTSSYPNSPEQRFAVINQSTVNMGHYNDFFLNGIDNTPSVITNNNQTVGNVGISLPAGNSNINNLVNQANNNGFSQVPSGGFNLSL